MTIREQQCSVRTFSDRRGSFKHESDRRDAGKYTSEWVAMFVAALRESGHDSLMQVGAGPIQGSDCDISVA